jgi:hypothetical protein
MNLYIAGKKRDASVLDPLQGIQNETSITSKRRRRSLYFDEIRTLVLKRQDTDFKIGFKELRLRTIELMREFAEDVEKCIKIRPLEEQEQYFQIAKQYMALKHADSLSEGLAPPVQPGGKILKGGQAHLLQYTSKQTDKADRYFVCRHKDCRFFGENIHWASTVEAGGWQFACPICGRRFHRFRDNDNLIKAHFIQVLRLPTGTRYLLSEWPQSAEDNFFLRIQEAASKLITEEMRNMTTEDIQGKLCLLLEREVNARRTNLVEIPFPQKAKNAIDALNISRTSKLPFSYKHIIERGSAVVGGYYDADTPILDHKDMTHYMAFQIALVQKCEQEGGMEPDAKL